MSRFRIVMFVAFVALTSVCVSATAWATGEEPPPKTPCVDLEKTCQDAAQTGDPITFDVTVSNCGTAVLYCRVKDLLVPEIVLDATLLPGETASVAGSYYTECGESTNQVSVKCGYQLSPDVFGNVYDEAEATCSVPCDQENGCTLTPGYWKTHSIYGPAPYDSTWALIGEDSVFFLSELSFYEVLWTQPSGGNAYHILSHAYIAARLNLLNGASIPADVETALNDATALFGLYTPEFIGGLSGRDGIRRSFLRMAGILDDYNNGISGPGHCKDDDTGDNGDDGGCD